MNQELLEDLGFDRVPPGAADRTVTELVNLSGRVAFVTGGAGTGLGHALVHRFAAQGAALAVADLDGDAAHRVAGEIQQRWGVRTEPIHCDVTDWDSVTAAMQQCVDTLGSLDIVVNDVGGGGPVGYVEDNSIADIEAGVRLNFISQLFCCKAALTHMIPKRSGAIVNISSEGGKAGMPGIAVYNACKSGVIGFTKSLAFEVSKYGIRVNCVCPGIMLMPEMVEMLKVIPEDDVALAPFYHSLHRVALGRGCLPEEVANVAAFLASDAASYVQGAAYSVGGGLEL